ncbi:MAG: hypothetical protein ACRENQ_02340 [Gemmatimonadaceae bacterium]
MDFRDFLFSILIFSFSVICVVSLTKIVLAFINRKAVHAQLPAEVSQRIERIEQIVETTAVEVERVSEAQRFTAKVLSERAAPGGLPASQAHGRVVTPH